MNFIRRTAGLLARSNEDCNRHARPCERCGICTGLWCNKALLQIACCPARSALRAGRCNRYEIR